MSFDDLKEHDGQKYKGMTVGQSHHWDYPDGTWNETKILPDLWEFDFNCVKGRQKAAPVNSGVPTDTEYFWYIVADQQVKKIDANHYQTLMKGLKYKVAHKRPYWRKRSCDYPEQQSEKLRKITFLKNIIQQIEDMKEE